MSQPGESIPAVRLDDLPANIILGYGSLCVWWVTREKFNSRSAESPIGDDFMISDKRWASDMTTTTVSTRKKRYSWEDNICRSEGRDRGSTGAMIQVTPRRLPDRAGSVPSPHRAREVDSSPAGQ